MPVTNSKARMGDNEVIQGQRLEYVGAAGTSGWRLIDCEVTPPAPLTNGGDPQFVNVSNALVDGCYFHDWLDGFYEKPQTSKINNHIEDFQLGGCDGLTIRNSYFINGETHAIFVRAWGSMQSGKTKVPTPLRGLLIENCVLGKTRNGYYSLQVMDDLLQAGERPSDVKVLGCAIEGSLAFTMDYGVCEVGWCNLPAFSAYALGVFLNHGVEFHDCTFAGLKDSTGKDVPLPAACVNCKIDPNVDLTAAPGYPAGPAVRVPPALGGTPAPTPTPTPTPPPTGGDDGGGTTPPPDPCTSVKQQLADTEAQATALQAQIVAADAAEQTLQAKIAAATADLV